MKQLTTHILDTANGCPAAGVVIELYQLVDGQAKQFKQLTTNQDGRTDSPILNETEFELGQWQLIFHIGDYFKLKQSAPSPFLDQVPILFNLTEEEHYHVPLLASPWSYSTYRGS